MVATAYRDTGLRTRALALWSAVGAGGAAAATVAGGVLTDLAGWRWGSWTSARVLAVLTTLAASGQSANPSDGYDRAFLAAACAALVAAVGAAALLPHNLRKHYPMEGLT
jgi:MFS family permease